jgi:ferredoxin, 2Fe-2S
MARITYIEHGGRRHVVDVKSGLTLMEGAVMNNVPGIDAECGGACACATCQVYIDEAWLPAVGRAAEQESDMLEFAANAGSGSRLSCQITITEGLDGLILRIPESQRENEG